MSDLSKRIATLSPEKYALFARRLKEKNAEAGRNQPVTRRAHSSACPLSFAQERLWFINQMEPENPVYNTPIAMRLSGTVYVEAIERSFTEIVKRHESLRTTFDTDDGQPVQVISAPAPVPVVVIDLADLLEPQRKTRALQIATDAARRCFDLKQGPILDVKLLRLAEQDHILLFTTHHIVCDEWSMGVLVREVVTLYEA